MLIFPSIVKAESYYFQEEFNETRSFNNLDPNKWITYPNTTTNFPTINELTGTLNLNQQNNTNQFPLIVSKTQALPPSDFSTEIKFQYTKVTYWGDGFGFSNQPLQNGNGVPNSLLTISVWQDRGFPGMTIQFDGNVVYTVPLNTNSHLFRVERVAKHYMVYLDNLLLYTSPETNEQTRYFWIGNPDKLNFLIPEWTTFNIDYIRVKSTAPEPFLRLPFDYESKHLSFNEAATAIIYSFF